MADTMVGATPVYDVCGNNNYNDGWGNGSWMWIFFLFVILAWGGNGFGFGNGNNGFLDGTLTRADLNEGFNNQSVMRKLNGIENGLCDGFYAQNTTMLQGFNGTQRDLCQGFASVNANINQARFDNQQCCCNIERDIDNVRYENSKNTRDITAAIHCEGEATRALINANTMQDLRDRLEARDRDLMTANFQLSQQAQSANLINELRPCAKPTYLTCSPYQAMNYPYGFNNGCGCGCGNNCGC